MRILLLFVLLYSSGVAVAAEQPQLIKDRLDEINYSLGHRLGRELLEQLIEFRPDVLWQGVYDGANNAEPFMSREAMALVLQRLQEESAATSTTTAAPPVQKRVTQPVMAYRLKGQKFIAENAQKADVKTLSSGVQYKVLKPGQGKQPKLTDAVLVNYKAKTIEGQIYDSSYPLGIPTPAEFTVNKLIPGLAEVLPLMQEGDKWEIFIPTQMAYKDAGPMAGQTVIYELELKEILPEIR